MAAAQQEETTAAAASRNAIPRRRRARDADADGRGLSGPGARGHVETLVAVEQDEAVQDEATAVEAVSTYSIPRRRRKRGADADGRILSGSGARGHAETAVAAAQQEEATAAAATTAIPRRRMTSATPTTAATAAAAARSDRPSARDGRTVRDGTGRGADADSWGPSEPGARGAAAEDDVPAEGRPTCRIRTCSTEGRRTRS